jgi:hypothetical protein
MRFLIDGYNLLFALGLLRKQMGARALERARAELLLWLHRAHVGRAGQVTVVFDGRGAREQLEAVQAENEMRVLFAVGRSADDFIEEMIRRDADPRKLTVVSSDHRIQAAAKRRRCISWDNSKYIDWALEHGHDPPKPPRPPAKPETPSPEETERWLREFGDVAADPEVKRFNRPFEGVRDPE